MAAKNTERFSHTVENYVRYRPHYPEQILSILRSQLQLSSDWLIADIGSGTGISSELVISNGNLVYAIEPNRAMRTWAEEHYGDTPLFVSMAGTAEATGVADRSVDLVLVGQAFHWFDQEQASVEFQRILKPEGRTVLMWNDRDLNDPFMQDYEQMLEELAVNYTSVCQRQVREEDICAFFAPKAYAEFGIKHQQHFDFEGLSGRLLSCSYAPGAEHPNHSLILDRLKELFDAYAVDGKVAFSYVCRLFCG